MPVVISCQVRDELRVGESVGIEVLEVKDDHVRIGITDPGQTPEYQERILYVASANSDDGEDGDDGEQDDRRNGEWNAERNAAWQRDRRLVGV